MSEETLTYLLIATFALPTISVATFLAVRQQRRRDWAWHRLVDFAEIRTEASVGLPDGTNDAIIAIFEAAAVADLARLEDTKTCRVPIDIRDALGQTPLLVAASRDRLEAVEWLVRNGAEVGVSDILGETPVLRAARTGGERLVEYLLRHGASTECKHVEGWTPLLVAALRGHEPVVRVLLAHGADTGATFAGKTPAVLAKQQGHASIQRLFGEVGQPN